MSKVTIISRTECNDWRDFEEVEVLVDGETVGIGWYGGEPEDNCRGRTYSWVEGLLVKLAKSLGADVTVMFCLQKKR